MVEDEVRLAETIRRGLVAEGFVTAVELNGDDGFATACSDEFDVIVLDIMLPGKHGYDIVRDLRAREIWTRSSCSRQRTANTTWLMHSISAPTTTCQAILVCRASRSAARTGASRRSTTSGDTLRWRPVARPGQTSGEQSGNRIDLTPREYSVLEFLMRNNGVVVTKTEIVRSVWDTNYEGDENIVEVYIGYLRKKLDLPFGTQSIETVRGVGYRFVGTA